MRKRRVSFMSLALLFLGACASVPKDAGFAAVSKDVRARTGYTVRWNRGGVDDDRAQKAVDELLDGGLTADKAVQVALLENHDLQAVYESLGVAQAQLVQAGLLKNPIFALGARFPVGSGSTDIDLSLVEDFLDVFYRPLREHVASSEFEAAKLRVTAAVIDLATETRHAYYQLVGEQQLLAMARTTAQAAAASYDAEKRIYTAGNSRPIDVYNERALDEEAKLDLADAREAVNEARERLNTLLGVWGSRTNWKARARLPQIPGKELVPAKGVVERALRSSLDLDIARQDIETAGQRLGLADASALVPTLEAGPAAEREDGDWDYGVGASVPIPLFDQGQAKKLAASAELSRARDRYVAVAVGVRSSARMLYERVRADRRRAMFYEKEVLPLQVRVLHQTQLLYNAMQLGVFQFLLAKERQIESRRRYIHALMDYWDARSDLEALLQGRRPSEGRPGWSSTMDSSSRGRR